MAFRTKMLLLEIIEGNRQLANIVYNLLLFIPSAIIFFRINSLNRIYGHKGLMHFRNTFLFLAAAFAARTIMGIMLVPRMHSVISDFISEGSLVIVVSMLNGIFEFALIMAFISLGYSLVWKHVSESIYVGVKVRTETLLYGIAILIAFIGYFTSNQLSLIAAIFFVMAYALHVTYSNYRTAVKDRKRNNLLQMFLITLIMISLILIMGVVGALITPIFPQVAVYVYVFTVGIFWLILFGILYMTDMR